MAVLYGKYAKRFLDQIEEDLKRPIGPIPTPKVDNAIREVMDELHKLIAQKFVTTGSINPITRKIRP